MKDIFFKINPATTNDQTTKMHRNVIFKVYPKYQILDPRQPYNPESPPEPGEINSPNNILKIPAPMNYLDYKSIICSSDLLMKNKRMAKILKDTPCTSGGLWVINIRGDYEIVKLAICYICGSEIHQLSILECLKLCKFLLLSGFNVDDMLKREMRELVNARAQSPMINSRVITKLIKISQIPNVLISTWRIVIETVLAILGSTIFVVTNSITQNCYRLLMQELHTFMMYYGYDKNIESSKEFNMDMSGYVGIIQRYHAIIRVRGILMLMLVSSIDCADVPKFVGEITDILNYMNIDNIKFLSRCKRNIIPTCNRKIKKIFNARYLRILEDRVGIQEYRPTFDSR